MVECRLGMAEARGSKIYLLVLSNFKRFWKSPPVHLRNFSEKNFNYDFFFLKNSIISSGNGNTIVEFFSDAISDKV